MARKSSKTPALTPHEMRLRNTDRKLRDAMERLVKGMPAHPDLQKRSYRLTVPRSRAKRASAATPSTPTTDR